MKALQILRELAQYSERFLPQMVGFVGFCVEKTLLLGELPQPDPDCSHTLYRYPPI